MEESSYLVRPCTRGTMGWRGSPFVGFTEQQDRRTGENVGTAYVAAIHDATVLMEMHADIAITSAKENESCKC